GRRLTGTAVRSHGDHRIAMALAVAGLTASGTTSIEGAESIGVSFPEFASLLEEGLGKPLA
ncbi:MAG TPA: 3-phosphoshikimate 1-carboxyvinyltransferase, partial [Vicinamibacteria bacterium]|nr:3-phosphoshikimate 1-carboxyvinyltransferase [Vicinamibacteria bacterium]